MSEAMFTIEQIKGAHSKVKSGADFPSYIQELKKLGVSHYETFVSDGHTDYFDSGHYKTTSPAKYDALAVSAKPDTATFKADLKAHQQGKTDYPTFYMDASKSGIEKWVVNINDMTCTYYDKKGNKILVEEIPR